MWTVIRLIGNSKRVNDLDVIFEDYGDVVGIRRGGDARFFRFPPKRIRKDRIIKVRQDNMIRLYTRSGSSYNIHVLDGNRDRIGQRAIEIFPEAEIEIINI